MLSIGGMSAQQSSLQALQRFVSSSGNNRMQRPGPQGMQGPGHPGGGQNPLLSDAASILGTSTSTLQSDLKSGQSLASVANSKGISTQDFLKQLENKAKSHMDQQVKNGNMTAQQETQMLTGLDSHLSQMISQTPHSHAHAAYQNAMMPQASPFSDAAKILGISTSTLKSDLKSGQSLADVAKSKGMSSQALLTKMEDVAKSHFDNAVQSGSMTSSQESNALSGVNSFLSSLINQTDQSLTSNLISTTA